MNLKPTDLQSHKTMHGYNHILHNSSKCCKCSLHSVDGDPTSPQPAGREQQFAETMYLIVHRG
jgi:hypothetical protein